MILYQQAGKNEKVREIGNVILGNIDAGLFDIEQADMLRNHVEYTLYNLNE